MEGVATRRGVYLRSSGSVRASSRSQKHHAWKASRPRTILHPPSMGRPPPGGVLLFPDPAVLLQPCNLRRSWVFDSRLIDCSVSLLRFTNALCPVRARRRTRCWTGGAFTRFLWRRTSPCPHTSWWTGKGCRRVRRTGGWGEGQMKKCWGQQGDCFMAGCRFAVDLELVLGEVVPCWDDRSN